MGKVALYRHYRSQDFSDLVGQSHVATTLENAVKSGQITHAYLFTGPRGVGKTSAARILARRVNKIDEVAHHPDIIEIDAASNNGVDEIRELREKVHVAPNYAQYKVYIIDEVHMLSTAAFNALLKTLEEPPAHAIFVLATTEPHKVPQTIISRTQHFPFRPINTGLTKKHLGQIAKKERIDITPAALTLLADLGEGSMRDSISLLDQVSTDRTQKIDVEQIEAMIGLAQSTKVTELLDAILSKDSAGVIACYDALLESGTSPQLLLKQLLLIVRERIRIELAEKKPVNDLREVLRLLSSVNSRAGHLEFALEAALLEASSEGLPMVALTQAKKNFQSRIASPPQRTATVSVSEPEAEERVKPKAPEAKESVPAPQANTKPLNTTAWVKALSLIKQKHNSLFGLLSNSQIDITDGTCTITTKFQFHFRRLNENKNRQAIADALKEACGQEIAVEIAPLKVKKAAKATTAKPAETAPKEADEDADAIAQVTKILGGEVMYG